MTADRLARFVMDVGRNHPVDQRPPAAAESLSRLATWIQEHPDDAGVQNILCSAYFDEAYEHFVAVGLTPTLMLRDYSIDPEWRHWWDNPSGFLRWLAEEIEHEAAAHTDDSDGEAS